MSGHCLRSRMPFYLMLFILGLTAPAWSATLTVTNSADSGPGSLRQTLATASPGDSILFDGSLNGQTIVLGSEIALTQDVSIQGPGADQLAISGAGTVGLFEIPWGVSAQIHIDGLTLQDGYKAFGGAALSVAGGGGNPEITISNVVISDQLSSALQLAEGQLNVANSTFANNADAAAAGSGGGGAAIMMLGGDLSVLGCSFNGNSAGDSGGAISAANPSSTTIIVNSTFTNNTANAGGGLSVGGDTAIFNTTLTGNTASGNRGGGGIQVSDGTLTIGNSLVAGNRAPAGGGTDIALVELGTMLSAGHNLFGEFGASGLSGVAPGATDSILDDSVDRVIGPLADHGGATPTHLPLAGGLAINSGDNALIPVGVTTDQRDFPRIVDAVVDIGAVERDPYFQAVQEIYIAYYGRPADPLGRTWWAQQLLTSAGNLDSIIQQFGSSEEFSNEYGGMTNEELITVVYQQMFCRAPDPAGSAFYLDQLDSGEMTLPTITLDVLKGAQNDDALIIEDKLQVADYFSSGVERLGVSYNADSIELARSVLDQVCGGPGDVAAGMARADLVLQGM